MPRTSTTIRSFFLATLLALGLSGCTMHHDYHNATGEIGTGYPVDSRGIGSEEKPLNGLKRGG